MQGPQQLIFIYQNLRQEGPYTRDQVRVMLASGSLSPNTLAWTNGLTEWLPLSSLLLSSPSPNPSFTTTCSALANRGDAVLQSPSEQTLHGKSKGVGGWLLFFCVGLTFLGPLFGFGLMVSNWNAAMPAFADYPSLKTAVIWENFGRTALLVYGHIIGFLIWSGRPTGLYFARQFLLIRLFGAILIQGVGILLLGDIPTRTVNLFIAGAVGAILGELFFFFIWWLYFKKSKRVRNTYG
jgi:hypothetical protein